MFKKKAWDILHKILPFKSNLPSTTKILIDFQNKSDNPKVVTNYFNRFFCSIAKTLAKHIPHSNIPTYRNYFTNLVSSPIFLSTPSINEIINVIYSLNVNKTLGHNNIFAFFLHSAAATIVLYLQCFLNFGYNMALFPTTVHSLKSFHFIKKGNKSDTNHYELISIPTCFSIILENFVYICFLEFLKKHSLIYKS